MSNDFPFDHFLKLNKDKSQSDVKLNLNPSFKMPSVNNNDQQDLSAINEEILNYLKTIVPEVKYKTYFEDNFNLSKLESGKATFIVKTSFILNFVSNYQQEIASTLANILGKRFEIFFEVEGSNELETKPKSVMENKFTLSLNPTREDLVNRAQAQYIEHMNPNKTGILIDRDKTFDNFIVGPTNNMAQAASKAVAQTPGKNGKYPSLYIHSNSGLGKTHLLHAAANEIADRYPELNICLITARDFMEEMIELMKKNKINEFVKKYTEKIDVLMIDDIHELKNKEGTQDQFFHVFNEMHQKGKQLIFTSDKRPKEIDGISERIKTRLQWGLVVDIQPPDLETRIAILRRKMESLDLYINENVLTLIATRIKANIRELEGSLVKLKAVSELMNVEIEIDLVKDQLMLNSNDGEKEITVEQISKAVAQYFKIPLADLRSKSRSQEITQARHIAMYLSRMVASAKQQEIGIYFGGRDHSSVIHALEKVKIKIKTDPSLAKIINAIESNL
jgi:chromosomal replication initiator protein